MGQRFVMCNQEDIETHIQFKQLPNVLLLILDRINEDGNIDLSPIHIDKTLQLPSLLQDSIHYKLRCIIQHHGNSHPISPYSAITSQRNPNYATTDTDKWALFHETNATSLSDTELDEACTSSHLAYILMYERVSRPKLPTSDNNDDDNQDDTDTTNDNDSIKATTLQECPSLAMQPS